MTRTRTTRYVTLLSVVLALALTAVLAACGSDEPSGATGPDRTASTPASGAAPTATDTPEPATAPPVLGQTSAETDREALVALYNATDGENWRNSDNWLSDRPLREWNGVDTEQGRVTYLVLTYEELNGAIPKELASLTELRGLDLTENRLSGDIPPELDSLTNLEWLHLYGNTLSGKIPAELGNLSNLTQLDLGANELSGKIPPEFGKLSSLERLWLKDNQLSGEIPSELGQLTNLQQLRLRNEDLSGCVPSSLEDRLDLSNSDLGDLPFC